MRRILTDQGVARGLRAALPGFEVSSAYQMGWDALSNGELIAAAEDGGFEVMITCDQNIAYQQNISGRRIAIVILGTTHWPTIARSTDRVLAAIHASSSGSFELVTFDRPTLRRRPPPPPNGGRLGG